jgi:hypothetical protein
VTFTVICQGCGAVVPTFPSRAGRRNFCSRACRVHHSGKPDVVIERFWRYVERTDDIDACWLWLGTRDKDGYGNFRTAHSTSTRAHRFAYRTFIGPIPPGLMVLHSCDTPACVRPGHLRLGTGRDNAADMVERGRQSRQQGTRHGAAKLNDRVVRFLRRVHGTRRWRPTRLAEWLGVSPSAVLLAAKGETWRHVDPLLNPPAPTGLTALRAAEAARVLGERGEAS